MQKSNSRNIVKDSCSICTKKFNGMFVSQHQCKRCLQYICKECCSKKKLIFTHNINNHLNTKTNLLKPEEHRVCDKCLQSNDKLNNYIKTNCICFNTLSKIGKQWLQIIEIDKSDVMHKEQKEQKQGKTKNQSKLKTNKIMEIWAKCSESFRQILGLSLAKIPITQANQMIDNFLMNKSSSDQQYYLAAYVMVHCDEKSGTQIYNYLNSLKLSINQQNINQYVSVQCQNSKQSINNPKRTKNLLNYTQKFGLNLFQVRSFFLKIMQIEIVNELIHQMILSGSPTVLELAISYLIFEYRQVILNQTMNEQQIKADIRNSIHLQNIDKGLKIIRKLIMKKSFESPLKNKSDNYLSPQRLVIKQQKREEQNENGDGDSEMVMSKMKEASQFLRKIEQSQIAEGDVDGQQIADLQRYLDLVISQNQQSLEEIEHFDGILSEIQEQLYKTSKP